MTETQIDSKINKRISFEYKKLTNRYNRWRWGGRPHTKRWANKMVRMERYIDDLLELYEMAQDYPFWRDKILTKADEYCVELIKFRSIYGR